MYFIRHILSRCFLVVEKLKGSKSITQHPLLTRPDVDSLTGFSIHGFEIQIFCDDICYEKQYTKWLFGRRYKLFRLYSHVSARAPEALKRACVLEITIPPPYPSFVLDDYQKEAAIEWYLDLLIRCIQEESSCHS
jgi:hypothetical protein